jgi:hypothetical protein
MTKIRQHRNCYGTMFHDSLHYSVNEKMQGKVFSFELNSAGLARSARTFQSDIGQWDDCLAGIRSLLQVRHGKAGIGNSNIQKLIRSFP